MVQKYFPIPVEDKKVVTSKEMARIEALAILEGDGSASQYMEIAALGIVDVVLQFSEENKLPREVILLCGKGNNAGDCFLVGKKLLDKGYKASAFHLFEMEDCSELCQIHAKSFREKGGEIYSAERVDFPPNVLVLDGLLGTGFRGKVSGVMKDVIEKINSAENPLIAIDIPSGVSGDTGHVETVAVIADVTIYLGLMKVGHLYNKGFDHVGELIRVDFGLSKKYIDKAEPFGHIVNKEIAIKTKP